MPRYVALIHKDDDSCYGVSFPDLPGIFTGGETFEEAMEEAADVLQFAAEGWINPDGSTGFKPPSNIEQLRNDPEFLENARDAVIAFVDITANTFLGRIEELNGVPIDFNRGGAVAGASVFYLLLSIVMGLVQWRFKPPLWLVTLIFVPATLGVVWLGTRFDTLMVLPDMVRHGESDHARHRNAGSAAPDMGELAFGEIHREITGLSDA